MFLVEKKGLHQEEFLPTDLQVMEICLCAIGCSQKKKIAKL